MSHVLIEDEDPIKMQNTKQTKNKKIFFLDTRNKERKLCQTFNHALKLQSNHISLCTF